VVLDLYFGAKIHKNQTIEEETKKMKGLINCTNKSVLLSNKNYL